MISTILEPLIAAAMARAIPVLPEVASIRVSPGLICPRSSARVIIDSAGRSLTEPAGLFPSSLSNRVLLVSPAMRCKRTRGVLPTQSAIVGYCKVMAYSQSRLRGRTSYRESLARHITQSAVLMAYRNKRVKWRAHRRHRGQAPSHICPVLTKNSVYTPTPCGRGLAPPTFALRSPKIVCTPQPPVGGGLPPHICPALTKNSVYTPTPCGRGLAPDGRTSKNGLVQMPVAMISLENLFPHRRDLPVNQRLKRLEQRGKRCRRLQHLQRLHNRLNRRQRTGARRLAQPVARDGALDQRHPGQCRQQRVEVQQLARLAPGAVGDHQQQRLVTLPISLQRPGIVSGKQQARLITRRVQQARQIIEYLAHHQLRILQAQRRQPRGIERMVDLARVLQQ